jgi:peroxiredoxin family protein
MSERPIASEETDPGVGVDTQLAALTGRVEALERSQPEDRLVLGLISGELDAMMAAFIVASGARAFDIEVDLFATFWATAAFRDPSKKVDKEALDRMFGMMLPSSSRRLPLSRMHMFGMGPRMIRKVMADCGGKSLEDLMREAGELGVRLHICAMTMDVMGIQPGELIDYPDIDYVGVGQFVNMMSHARHCWFF